MGLNSCEFIKTFKCKGGFRLRKCISRLEFLRCESIPDIVFLCKLGKMPYLSTKATIYRQHYSADQVLTAVIISKLNSPHEVCTVQKFQQHNSCGISVRKNRGFRKDLHYLGLYGIQLFGTPAEDQPISPQYQECDDGTFKLLKPLLKRFPIFCFYW